MKIKAFDIRYYTAGNPTDIPTEMVLDVESVESVNTNIFKFDSRPTFDLASLIVQKLEVELGENYCDVSGADMLFSVFNKFDADVVRSELAIHQIWDIPSFKGEPDFSITNVGLEEAIKDKIFEKTYGCCVGFEYEILD